MSFCILDANSLLYRAYFALPALNGPDGVPTGAVTGFLNSFLKIIREYEPTHIAAAFDAHGPTFRHADYEGYKAGRPPTPDDLRTQFDLLKQGLAAMGVAMLEQPGIEADDWLGSVSILCKTQEIKCFLFTGDRDALQLVDDNTTVIMEHSRAAVQYTPEYIREKYCIGPERMIDLKALMGDASDRIPGVPGVGEKTALKLLCEYGWLENLYENIKNSPGKLGEKHTINRDLA
ncbi:MAG: DNA polymerase I, partial [Clostridia bacterium]|nr:DNA polymerase I [Clostridia bacterium]